MATSKESSGRDGSPTSEISLAEQEAQRVLACANHLGIDPGRITEIKACVDGGGHYTGLNVVCFIHTGRLIPEWVKKNLPTRVKTPAGVRLILEPRTRVPLWIRSQNLNFERFSDRRGDGSRKVSILVIRGGEASFIPGGAVEVKMPGSSNSIVAFDEGRVLEIRTLNDTRLVKANRRLCSGCFTLTGEISECADPKNTVGRRRAIFSCSQCGRQWEARV